jgi:hypothetical protein
LNFAAARLDVLVWAFVFVGLLVVGLGVSLQRGGAPYGWAVAVAGALFVTAGGVLVWLRSRIRDPEA